jgi:hypothetical protein
LLQVDQEHCRWPQDKEVRDQGQGSERKGIATQFKTMMGLDVRFGSKSEIPA